MTSPPNIAYGFYPCSFFVIELLEFAASIELVGLCVYVLARMSKKACRCCGTE